MKKKINLKSLSQDELESFILGTGLPRYRADQLVQWIYRRRVSDIDAITVLSKNVRDALKERCYISSLNCQKTLRSSDGTEKFLFSLEDGSGIESILIPDKDRLTLCISSQVGCSLGCKFCHTGRLGLIRNLKAHEIVDQILTAQKIAGSRKQITNIVLMGMGEPLLNFNEVVEALWRIVSFIGISPRRITLSTAGIVPKISLLSQKAPPVNLAISLNAPTDEVRSSLMPVNRRYPIRALISACRNFPLPPRRRITFEYVLVGEVNDSPEDAMRLVKLLRGLRCKVNLIPVNPYPGFGLKRPSETTIDSFQNILIRHNITALIRKSKGQDIQAACGQLRGSDIQKPPGETDKQ